MSVTIFHNPRCSKSRQTLELIREAGIEPNVVEYLKTPLSAQAIEELVALMGCPVIDICRTNESEFKERELSKSSSNAELIAAMVASPIIMNRPIVQSDKGAVLCRPPELVKNVLP
ncbi:MAG: arsenate reductase (glutaredoxin) [Pseudohongiellaceae bacterium]|nr:arsenate reductase (glutaredoxin) [Pseudohongiellaceae bacterium]